MLGRKQSIKVDAMADYGENEMMNESADIEWINKVRKFWKTSTELINVWLF